VTLNRSKSTLFLIEQLIVVAVFAICAVACIRIISTAYLYSRDSRDVGFAIIAAENVTESFKAVSGELEHVAYIIGGSVAEIDGMSTVTIYYDKNWQVTDAANALYVLHLNETGITNYFSHDRVTHTLIEGNISARRITGDELISFNVAAISTG